MSKPLIGLPGRRKRGADIAGAPETLADHPVDLYFVRYANAIMEAGGIPVHIPVGLDPLEIVPHLDGVVLTGGADIEPQRYGHDPDGNGEYEPLRDEREFVLLAGALDRGLPVLGICRGIQVINVHAGGTLHQHLPAHAHFEQDAAHRVHEVYLEPDSILGRMYPEAMKVNSLHHQAIDRLGHGLRAVATDGDGLIEAVENAEGRVLGVQWHPEMYHEPEPIFDWFVETAARTAAESASSQP